MKLTEIRLKNFRQFYGDQRLQLSTDEKQNVTLIHAENGFGKTTLLNSILWTFFFETTSRFEKKEDIVNYAARKEGITIASVEVAFEHEGQQYLAQRIYRTTNRTQEFHVSRIDDGSLVALRAPDTFINSVIPKEMARYFFFDGEQAEAFASEENQGAVGNAIRSILGCQIAETAIEDLQAIAAILAKEIGNLPGVTRLKELERQLEALTTIEAKQREDAKRFRATKLALEQQIEAINESLRKTEVAGDVQRAIDKIDADLRTTGGELRSIDANIVRWVGAKSLPLVSGRLAAQTLDFIDKEALKGRIPSPYNEQFVKSLLEARECVCGRPIEPTTEEWKHVADLLKGAARAETLGRVMRAHSKIAGLQEARRTAPEDLKDLRERKGRLLERQRSLEIDRSELIKKLEGIPTEGIAEQQRARKDLTARLDVVRNQLRDAERDADEAKQNFTTVESQLNQEAIKHKISRPLNERRSLAIQSASHLKSVLSTYETIARQLICRHVNDILSEAAHKQYQMEIDDDFGLHLKFSSGQLTPKSGGENQLMSLAFIAALVQFANERAKRRGSEILLPGTVAPLVLDSPFGQLDSGYRKSTATFVPDMAPQVVLLVSSSQGKDEVLKAVAPRVGAEYVLVSENTGRRDKKRGPDPIVINGKLRTVALYDCERDMTTIERVR